MLIVLDTRIARADRERIEQRVRDLGCEPVAVAGPTRVAICVTGNEDALSEDWFLGLPGVRDVLRVTRPYKLAAREVRPEPTVVRVGEARIGGGEPVLIAGPCSVETEARTRRIAAQVRDAGATVFRAGAFKPRTSPYSFQGLGVEGLHTLRRIREDTGLAIVTEVLDPESVERVADAADMLQIGARNMQNAPLLRRVGRVDRPVLLKRGPSASLEEWLMAAEYILSEGNPRVVLCERGIRTHSLHSRNTLDLNAV